MTKLANERGTYAVVGADRLRRRRVEGVPHRDRVAVSDGELLKAVEVLGVVEEVLVRADEGLGGDGLRDVDHSCAEVGQRRISESPPHRAHLLLE